MNKITFFPRQVLRIECVRSTRLGEFWSRCLLSGPYWRLYLHSDHGAGIRIDGEKHELAPDKLHLLPPNCNLQTWCDNPEVKQLYLHFETPCLRGSRCICNTIELTPDLRVLTDRLNTLSDEETPLRMLHATALASSALTRLPPEALESHICDHQMQQLANLMRDSPGHPWSVGELAARAGIGGAGKIGGARDDFVSVSERGRSFRTGGAAAGGGASGDDSGGGGVSRQLGK